MRAHVQPKKCDNRCLIDCSIERYKETTNVAARCPLRSADSSTLQPATAVNSTAYHTRGPSVLCRSGAPLEQSAARDSKFGLIADIPTND